MIDLVLENGIIVDGSGAPAFSSDVGVCDGAIVEIGQLSTTPARRRFDATGLVVAPGFLDIHTHSDYTLLANPSADSSVRQGVTTEVIGNCGFSAAPIRDVDDLSRLVVAHIPEIPVDWRGFGGYLDRLGRGGLGINIVPLVGHGAIRAAVMGFEAREATGAEIRKMRDLLSECLEEGAFGFSSGLEYAPGANATEEELVSLCEVVSSRDAIYSTHVRNRDLHFVEGFTEALEVARATGVRLQISHVTPKYGAPEDAASRTLELMSRWREAGVDVASDVMLYTKCPTTLASILPSWALDGGSEAVLSRLANREARKRFKVNPTPIWRLVVDHRWDRISLFRSSSRPGLVGRSFAEISEAMGCDPFDAACDLLLAEGDRFNDVWMLGQLLEERDVWAMLRDPQCAICSDGMSISPTGVTAGLGWGPRCYGWTALALRVLVREQRVLSLEEAIRRMTSLPASRVGLSDRGLVRRGYRGDLVVLDPERVADQGSYADPPRYPLGIDLVTVNGEIVVEGERQTGALPGRVLRKGR